MLTRGFKGLDAVWTTKTVSDTPGLVIEVGQLDEIKRVPQPGAAIVAVAHMALPRDGSRDADQRRHERLHARLQPQEAAPQCGRCADRHHQTDIGVRFDRSQRRCRSDDQQGEEHDDARCDHGELIGVRVGMDLHERSVCSLMRVAWRRTVELDRQCDVLQGVLRQIRYGQTCSYPDVADRIDKPTAVRVVRAANVQNPLPIVVPCRRVVGANGTLTGYGGRLEKKRMLLDLESDVLLI